MIRHVSTRFNIDDMDPEERRNLFIKELGLTWGQAWSALVAAILCGQTTRG